MFKLCFDHMIIADYLCKKLRIERTGRLCGDVFCCSAADSANRDNTEQPADFYKHAVEFRQFIHASAGE